MAIANFVYSDYSNGESHFFHIENSDNTFLNNSVVEVRCDDNGQVVSFHDVKRGKKYVHPEIVNELMGACNLDATVLEYNSNNVY